jgi:hypothetical protein
LSIKFPETATCLVMLSCRVIVRARCPLIVTRLAAGLPGKTAAAGNRWQDQTDERKIEASRNCIHAQMAT